MQILPIGGYFHKDKNGYLINPAKWDHVSDKYQQLIYKFIDKIPSQEKEWINSIYLRGSLPRGIDEQYITDIDLLALTNKKGMRWEQENWVDNVITETKIATGLIIDVEFYTTTYDNNLLKNYPQLAAILKTQSLCISGPDFTEKLPQIKPGKALAMNYRWLENDIKMAVASNSNSNSKKIALKTLIRTGFEIVMEREKEFTLDLYWCCKSYGKWYPKFSNQMTAALDFYLNPLDKSVAIDGLLSDFGKMIVKESLKYLP